MTEATRIRAQLTGDKATVRILMTHEMESGQRKDPLGKLVPAWFIQEVTVQHEWRSVLTAQWGPAMSRNPFLQCVLKGARAGDRITVSWVDNRGERRTDEATVGT
jgi:sulfur-oxidizing protein SoxZ